MKHGRSRRVPIGRGQIGTLLRSALVNAPARDQRQRTGAWPVLAHRCGRRQHTGTLPLLAHRCGRRRRQRNGTWSMLAHRCGAFDANAPSMDSCTRRDDSSDGHPPVLPLPNVCISLQSGLRRKGMALATNLRVPKPRAAATKFLSLKKCACSANQRSTQKRSNTEYSINVELQQPRDIGFRYPIDESPTLDHAIRAATGGTKWRSRRT